MTGVQRPPVTERATPVLPGIAGRDARQRDQTSHQLPLAAWVLQGAGELALPLLEPRPQFVGVLGIGEVCRS